MADKRIACLVGSGFEDSELIQPYNALREAGHQVDLIGAEVGKELHGKRGEHSVKVEKSIDEVKPGDYHALFIPGGHSPDELRADERFVEFARAFDELQRPIAAICHGPQLLMSAGLVDGHTLTAWSTVQEDLKHTGATVKDEEVVVDGHWITSRKPDDLPRFKEAFLGALA